MSYEKEISPPSSFLTIDELLSLARNLENVGFDIEVNQIINAAKVDSLWLAMAVEGELITPERLSTILAPVFCVRVEEQVAFYQYFQEWLVQRPDVLQRFERNKKKEGVGSEGNKKRYQWRVLLAILMVLLLFVVFVIAQLTSKTSITLTVINQEDGLGLSNAAVVFQDRVSFDVFSSLRDSHFTDDQGLLHFDQLPQGEILSFLIALEGYRELRVDSLVVVDNLEETYALVRESSGSGPEKDSLPKEVPELLNVAVEINVLGDQSQYVSEPQFWQRVIRDHKILLQIISLSIPCLLFLIWISIRLRRQRLILKRKSTRSQPQQERVNVQGLSDHMFRNTVLRRTVQQLRQHEEVSVPQLDAQETVEATIRRGGLFTPVYASSYKLPEYLVLIDRTSFNDQYARLIASLVERMVYDGVLVDYFYFDSDPRVCQPSNQQEPRVWVSDLLRDFPRHRLILFSNGQSLIDPVTGSPYIWLDTFLEWQHSAIFIPSRSKFVTYLEGQFRLFGFQVRTASTEGLSEYIKSIVEGPDSRQSELQRQPSYPNSLVDRIDRWLQRYAPEAKSVEELIAELKQYLEPETFNWLCACAFYPELHWELTLFLATSLTLEDRDTLTDKEQLVLQARLADLTRLPWFREGMIPDWLRLRLIAEMPRENNEQVRSVLHNLLTSVRKQEDSTRHSIELSYVKNTLREVVLDRMNFGLGKTSVKDYVFASYMSSRNSSLLSVLVPKPLQRLIYQHGLPSLGIRPIAVAVFLGIIAISLLFAINQLQPEERRSWMVQFDMNSIEGDSLVYSEESVAYYVSIFSLDGRVLQSEEERTAFLQSNHSSVSQYNSHLLDFLIDNIEFDTSRFQFSPKEYDEWLVSIDQANFPFVLKKSTESVQVDPPPNEKVNSIGMKFTRIDAGEFVIGYNRGDLNERPEHQVLISGDFYMGTYEVTQDEWTAVMGRNPSYFRGGNRPVESVSWNDVHTFIDRLSAMENCSGCYRLPTEAEWEYAARASTRWLYSFGNREEDLSAFAWYKDNSGGATHPVGTKLPNQWGLYDMHGNVWEWVQDWFGNYSGEMVDNPSGPPNGRFRIIRGGSWDYSAWNLRSANRGSDLPENRNFDYGFRLVWEIE